MIDNGFWWQRMIAYHILGPEMIDNCFWLPSMSDIFFWRLEMW